MSSLVSYIRYSFIDWDRCFCSRWSRYCMMTSSNGNIFHVTGPLWGKFTGEFPSQKPVTRSFGAFFDLRLNKRLSKPSTRWWFETPSRSLWRQCNGSATPITNSEESRPSPLHQQWPLMGVMASQITNNSTVFQHVVRICRDQDVHWNDKHDPTAFNVVVVPQTTTAGNSTFFR